ncbi:hypothetical protein JCGZ_04872 [Jatropha curcas]|uniref:Glycosyltransferase n=1 Tax=Jatropha curcas TaxID=180498 RepID=A0A067L2E1_JATCU|nr:anthocyanidin 3-O-glucosyltransferase 7 [Jatropha curcas]KDP38229.1 hypothetical protein JCGZ_04872 [Jatropha curcas]
MERSTSPTKPKKHVAVLAFPFGCHPLALLNLVKKLAMAVPDIQFSFFNLANSNNYLFSASEANNLPSNLRPYSVGDGVPLNHVFSGHPIERLDLFIEATPENYKKGLELAVAEMGQINCLITDAFLAFAGAMANDFNVPWIPVWIPVPHSLSVHIYTDTLRQYYRTNDDDNNWNDSGNDRNKESKTLQNIPGLAEIRVEDLPDEINKETLLSCMLGQMGHVLPQGTALVMNFYEELYPKPLLDDLKSKISIVLNVGFVTLSMPPPPLPLSNTDATGCLSWLDTQKTKSVAYISFGTVVGIPPNEIKELAKALEESKIPYLWSIRDNLRENLPNEFLEKTNWHGKVVSWAPQTQVLAHSSVGVYVTHCGANSVYESVANGVPMICRPVFADNMINARIVEEIWETGVRVDGGVFTKNGLIKNLKFILEHEDGKGIRKKAEDLQELILKAAAPNGNAAQDFKNLVEVVSSNQ